MEMLPSGGIVCAAPEGSGQRKARPLVSLVIPMFNEREGLDKLFEAVERTMGALDAEHEIICVDDGSTDGTYDALAARDGARIRAFRLSRNYGKEVALSAGLDMVRGDVVIPLDADLQEPPHLIPQMLDQWRAGFDVVFAVRRSREVDGKVKAGAARLFYKLYNTISATKIPENAGDFRLMDRRVVNVLQMIPERNRFMKGLLSWPGFRCTAIEFDRPARAAGESKWKPHKLVGLAMDGVTSFSILPLRLASFLGGVISLVSFLFGIFVIFKRLLMGDAVQGWASMMTVIVFLGGVQLLALGIVGEYIGRIYLESKRRPLYVIMESSDDDRRS